MNDRPIFLDPSKFRIVAGEDVVNVIREGRTNVAMSDRRPGYFDSEDLCAQQRKEASRGYVSVEIVASIHGSSVRYDSGLQDFGLVASSRSLGGTLEDAERFVREWVAADPSRRYGWVRI